VWWRGELQLWCGCFRRQKRGQWQLHVRSAWRISINCSGARCTLFVRSRSVVTQIYCIMMQTASLLRSRCFNTISHGLALRYLSGYIQRVAYSNRRRLCSSSSSQLVIHGFPLSTIVHLRWLVAASGTVCRLTSPKRQRRLFIRNRLKTYLFPIISFLTVLSF